MFEFWFQIPSKTCLLRLAPISSTSPVFTVLLLEPFLEPRLYMNLVFLIFILVSLVQLLYFRRASYDGWPFCLVGIKESVAHFFFRWTQDFQPSRKLLALLFLEINNRDVVGSLFRALMRSSFYLARKKVWFIGKIVAWKGVQPEKLLWYYSYNRKQGIDHAGIIIV